MKLLDYETHPTGHNTSEVDWGGHDPNPNHINESLLSEVDWGAHDSSVILFLVNIDYDAQPNESSIQGLWGELQHRTSSIPLIGLQPDSLATGQAWYIYHKAPRSVPYAKLLLLPSCGGCNMFLC